MRQQEVTPLDGVERGVLVVGRFLGGFELGFHEQQPGFAIHFGKLLGREIQIGAEFFSGKLVHVGERDDRLRGGAIDLAEEQREGFAGDEREDEEDHQDSRERDEEDAFLDEPLERVRFVTAPDADPAERGVGFGSGGGHSNCGQGENRISRLPPSRSTISGGTEVQIIHHSRRFFGSGK